MKERFAAAITRRRYCELVRIHASTLEKWERRGIVQPRLVAILNSPTRVFSEEDVAFGQRLIALLREESGRVSLEEAARVVRGRVRG